MIGVHDSPAGGIIVIKMDDKAHEDLVNADSNVRVGAAGLVKLVVTQQRGETKRLEAKIDRVKKRKEDLARDQLLVEKELEELVKGKDEAVQETVAEFLKSNISALDENAKKSNIIKEGKLGNPSGEQNMDTSSVNPEAAGGSGS